LTPNKKANKSIHSDSQKRRGFRYATATPLLAAGDAKRYTEKPKRGPVVTHCTSRIFFILLVLLPCAAFAQADSVQSDFRGLDWGATEAEIVASEGADPKIAQDADALRVLVYEDRLAGLDCNVIYILTGDKLVRAKYMATESHTNKTDYLLDYGTMHGGLSAKYGEPNEDETYWKNDLYKDDPSDWGMAVAVGHLIKYASWELPGTTITVGITGDNFDIELVIEYVSKELEEVEETAKEQAERAKF